jgi:hypothetical protein
MLDVLRAMETRCGVDPRPLSPNAGVAATAAFMVGFQMQESVRRLAACKIEAQRDSFCNHKCNHKYILFHISDIELLLITHHSAMLMTSMETKGDFYPITSKPRSLGHIELFNTLPATYPRAPHLSRGFFSSLPLSLPFLSFSVTCMTQAIVSVYPSSPFHQNFSLYTRASPIF